MINKNKEICKEKMDLSQISLSRTSLERTKYIYNYNVMINSKLKNDYKIQINKKSLN